MGWLLKGMKLARYWGKGREVGSDKSTVATWLQKMKTDSWTSRKIEACKPEKAKGRHTLPRVL